MEDRRALGEERGGFPHHVPTRDDDEGTKIGQVFELMLEEIKNRGFHSRMNPVVTQATDPSVFTANSG